MSIRNSISFTFALILVYLSWINYKQLKSDVFNKLLLNCILSFINYLFLIYAIPLSIPLFLKAKHGGIDMGKSERKFVPESLGIICGAFYLVTVFIYIPFNFLDISFNHLPLIGKFSVAYPILKSSQIQQNELNIMLAALLCICCMLMLGFVDDILNLRWRQKLIFPFVASLPILTVYLINYNVTHVMLPKPWHFVIDLGIFYYVFMVMVVIFCTNSINIMAGINGLEPGQSIVIAISILIFNVIEIDGTMAKAHFISFVLLMPFLTSSLALLHYNWYPADVFVGDTYCYFAGIIFASVGILGHFTKTMMLFFLPQIFNFIFSVPQLFHIVSCPRHRLPKYDSRTELMSCSHFEFRESELNFLNRNIIRLFTKLNLISVHKVPLSLDTYKVTNFTIINFCLNYYGPMKESQLTTTLLVTQILSSCLAFFIRYYLSSLLY